jgi:hypothetical protein
MCARERRQRYKVVNVASGFVCTVEAYFTIFCLVQCCINYGTRSYAGGDAACALQGFYSTSYTVASLGSVVLALFCSYKILTTRTCVKAGQALGAAVVISLVAILVGLFPVMGAGSYIFAVDYCMYNLEGLFYQIVMPFFYLPSLALVAFFVVNGYKKAIDAEAKRKAAYLLLFGLFWFVVWLPAVIIWGLSVAGAPPTTTDWWRIYGAHAIIFHSQQLGNLLLYGFLWRRLMNDYLDSVQQLPKEVKELEVVQGPALDVAPYNTPVGPQAPPYGYYPPAPTGVPQYPMYPAAAPYTVTYYPSYSAY